MRLIDADTLMEQMKRRKEFVGRASDPVCLVEDAPTIDDELVRHGHWEIKRVWSPAFPIIERSYCSLCGRNGNMPVTYNYCPHCGAKMDEVDE